MSFTLLLHGIRALLLEALAVNLLRQTHLDDQVPLGVTGHSAELSRQLLELRPAVRINHPAWGGETEQQRGVRKRIRGH